jgi:hypothetical protein
MVIFYGNYALSFINCTQSQYYGLFPQHVLKWHFIENMDSLGIRYFDLNFAGNPKGNKKDLNIRSFKKGWGEVVKFHEFCCYTGKKFERFSKTEKDRILKIIIQNPAATLLEIASKSGFSMQKTEELLKTLWAFGMLPGQPKIDKKIRYLLEQNKDVWDIARETNRAPRYILRFKYYLRNINVED